MKKQRIGIALIVALAALIVVLAGCNTGIPGLTEGYGAVTLDIQGTLAGSGGPSATVVASRAASVASRAAGDPVVIPITDVSGAASGTLTLTDARINLGEIELDQDDDEIDTEEETAQSTEIEFEGPFVVDFVWETVTPDLPQIELLPGTYDNIELKLDKVDGDDLDAAGEPLVADTDPLFGNSIYLEGTYTGTTAGGDVIDMPFSLSFDFDEEFELSGIGDTATGLLVEDGQLNPIIVAFRMAQWFVFDNPETNSDGLIDFGNLVTDAGPVVALDESATGDNATIREIIKDNIEESADYGEDEDGSGELESDEDDDPDEEDGDDT